MNHLFILKILALFLLAQSAIFFYWTDVAPALQERDVFRVGVQE